MGVAQIELALLGVNRSIRKDAAALFFAYNDFYFHTEVSFWRFFTTSRDIRSYVRNVTIGFWYMGGRLFQDGLVQLDNLRSITVAMSSRETYLGYSLSIASLYKLLGPMIHSRGNSFDAVEEVLGVLTIVPCLRHVDPRSNTLAYELASCLYNEGFIPSKVHTLLRCIGRAQVKGKVSPQSSENEIIQAVEDDILPKRDI